MTWRSSEDDENKVPSPTRPFSVGKGQGKGGQFAPDIFEREGWGGRTESGVRNGRERTACVQG